MNEIEKKEREERQSLRDAAFIVWINWGQEGWRPETFQYEAEMIDWLERGASQGCPFIITRAINLKVS